MRGNYDTVAPFYDHMARAVFGKSLQKAQTFLLPAIPPNARILIVGGGTGSILEEMSVLHPGGLDITYVEFSRRMISRAQKRNIKDNKLYFINLPIQEARLGGTFDVVATPFLLDNFSAKTLQQVFQKLDLHLKKKGLWLFADFQTANIKPGQKTLLKLMYLFFNLLCRLETSTLHDPSFLFDQYGYTPVQQKTFQRGFVRSVVFKKV